MPTTFDPANEVDRVRRYTSPEMLQKIDEQIEHNVAFYASQPDEVIAERIRELQQEWSINRFLQAKVAAMTRWEFVQPATQLRQWNVSRPGDVTALKLVGLPHVHQESAV